MTDVPIIFVTGKGGVGKSTVAAALAHQQARAGKKVLLAELTERSYFAEFFSKKIGYDPVSLEPNLDVAAWNPEACLHEYVLHYFKLESLYRLFFDNPMMKVFVQVAPSVAELAILGKITSGIRKVGPPLNYDLIVVDAYATGHFLTLLRACKGILKAIEFGPIAEESKGMLKILENPKQTQYVISTLPEDLPMTEAIELYQGIQKEVGRKSHVVMNKALNVSLDDSLKSSDNLFEQFLYEKADVQAKATEKWKEHFPDVPLNEIAFFAESGSQDLVNRMVQQSGIQGEVI